MKGDYSGKAFTVVDSSNKSKELWRVTFEDPNSPRAKENGVLIGSIMNHDPGAVITIEGEMVYDGSDL